jgi:hypothetical protein
LPVFLRRSFLFKLRVRLRNNNILYELRILNLRIDTQLSAHATRVTGGRDVDVNTARRLSHRYHHHKVLLTPFIHGIELFLVSHS